MGFIILTSDNQNLSYVIKKNPQTAPHVRPLRKGLCIGWFSATKDPVVNPTQSPQPSQSSQIQQPSQYVIKFMDTNENVSFPKNHEDEYDYLPYMQYCAPIMMTSVVKEMFGTVLNQGSSEDKTGICSLEQGVMKLSNKAIKLVDKMNVFIKKYRVDLRPTNIRGMYGFTLSSDNSTISELLQYAYLLGCTLNCMTFGYNEKPDGHALDKIIKIMNSLSVPYYIRYTFKNYMIGRKEFARVKKDLEGSNDINVDKDKLKISMVYGNTQSQRCDFISNHVLNFCNDCMVSNKQIHIVDIGCGEGYYVRNLLKLMEDKKFQNVTYHAHDIDEKEMNKIDTLVKTDELYSVVRTYRSIDDLITSLNNFTKDNEIMIVFSEVIEHILLTEVKHFMVKILSEIKFKNMLITTPSSEFNVHYLLAKNEYRHPDHKQEFTKQEFIDFIDDVLRDVTHDLKIKISTCYAPVGDCVNDIGMSQSIILHRYE